MLTINVGNSTYRLQGSQIFVVLANGQPTINGLTGMFREVTPTTTNGATTYTDVMPTVAAGYTNAQLQSLITNSATMQAAMTMLLDAENMLWAAVSAALAPTPAPAPKPSTK
jgi:hypothetical protein